MGDKIACYGGDTHRSKTGRRVTSDHQLKCIEGASERRTESTCDCRRGATADHNALIGAAQVKSAAAQRGCETAGKLGVTGFQSNRSADSAGPYRLRRHDDTAAKRHPPAMQGVGFDRVDFTRRPPSQQQQKRQAQK